MDRHDFSSFDGIGGLYFNLSNADFPPTTGIGSQGPCLKKPNGPKPAINPYAYSHQPAGMAASYDPKQKVTKVETWQKVSDVSGRGFIKESFDFGKSRGMREAD